MHDVLTAAIEMHRSGQLGPASQLNETVTDLESVARRMVAACGLEWEPACLEFYRTERPVRTASVAQVREPVYQRSVARWKKYESALTDLFAALASDQDTQTQPS
jgi:hypothetical protein